MDYVVTGGAGAIGSRLVARLLTQSTSRVVVVDNFSSGHAWLLPDHPQLAIVRGELYTWSYDRRYEEGMAGAVVIHLAAHFANQNSVDHPDDDLETNGVATLALMQWAERVGAKLVVYAGAGCSVGSERTPYQITKALGESYCRYFREQRGLSTRIVRLRNSYGPGEVPGKYRNAIPNWIWAAMHDEPLIVYGNGKQTRDFVFVDDAVDALLPHPWDSGDKSVGTGEQWAVREVVDIILSALPYSKSRVEHRPARPWEHQHPPISAYDVKARTPFVTGLRRTIEWFEANMDRIRESVR